MLLPIKTRIAKSLGWDSELKDGCNTFKHYFKCMVLKCGLIFFNFYCSVYVEPAWMVPISVANLLWLEHCSTGTGDLRLNVLNLVSLLVMKISLKEDDHFLQVAHLLVCVRTISIKETDIADFLFINNFSKNFNFVFTLDHWCGRL